MPKIPVPLLIDQEDAEALERLRGILQLPRCAILRYALRHYALYGSWRLGPDAPVPEVPLYAPPIDLGPDYREVG